jgi:hypothetical protein
MSAIISFDPGGVDRSVIWSVAPLVSGHYVVYVHPITWRKTRRARAEMAVMLGVAARFCGRDRRRIKREIRKATDQYLRERAAIGGTIKPGRLS